MGGCALPAPHANVYKGGANGRQEEECVLGLAREWIGWLTEWIGWSPD